MKIDQLSKSVTSATTGDKPQRTNRQETAQPEQDSVELSALSAQLNAAQADAASDSVDMERVQEIKQAIAEGRFKVNAEVVADRLLETVRELLQSRTLQ